MEAELRAHQNFYKHCRAIANRHLQYKLTEDVNYGQVVRPLLHMYLAPSCEWQELLAKPLAMQDINILAQIYAIVPQYLFDTALVTKKYHFHPHHQINFDNPGYTERSDHQIVHQYEEMS